MQFSIMSDLLARKFYAVRKRIIGYVIRGLPVAFLFKRLYIIERISNLKLWFVAIILDRSNVRRPFTFNPKVVKNYVASEIISSHVGKLVMDVYNHWDEADYLFGRGLYWESLELRKNLMAEIYAMQGNHEPQTYPRLMSSSFTVAIGHLGCLLLHREAQQRGFLVNSKRTALLGKKIGNQEAIQLMKSEFDFTGVQSVDTTYFLPITNLVENLQIFRGVNDFYDRYELWEKIFQSTNGVRSTHLQETEEKVNYEIKCERKLSELGIKNPEKLAVFHIRNNGVYQETRNVSPKPFVAAAQYLQQKGYTVFQIGANEHNRISEFMNGIIDLNEKKYENVEVDLDFYLLYKAALFVGTTSGPSMFPQFFNIPSLITNLTSISRNALSGQKTLYIPKKIKRLTGDELSFGETLASRLSFGGEYTRNQFRIEELEIIDNSEKQILDGVDELLTRVINATSITETSLDSEVSSLQNMSKVVSFGKFANSCIGAL